MGQKTTIYLGIDPGTDRVGLGIIAIKNNTPQYVGSKILPIKKSLIFGETLLSLEKNLKKEIQKYKPNFAGVESLFFGSNKTTAISVAGARGIIVKTLAEYKIPMGDFSPSHIKKIIQGSGSANKKEVAHMVSFFLGIPTQTMIDDEVDALAIALAAWVHLR